MFDVGAGELGVIALLILLVLGPKRLPEVMRKLGQIATKSRRLLTAMQNEIMSDDEPKSSKK